MTPTDLRALLAAASLLPWADDNDEETLRDASGEPIFVGETVGTQGGGVVSYMRDRKLIVAAVNSLPDLLSENERLKAELEAAKGRTETAVLEEREACARIADRVDGLGTLPRGETRTDGQMIADEIRDRSRGTPAAKPGDLVVLAMTTPPKPTPVDAYSGAINLVNEWRDLHGEPRVEVGYHTLLQFVAAEAALRSENAGLRSVLDEVWRTRLQADVSQGLRSRVHVALGVITGGATVRESEPRG